MRKLAIYIDGGPFTDAVRGQGLSMDMDYPALLRGLAKDEDKIVSTAFITPDFPDFPYPTRHRNEARRHAALEAQGIAVDLCKPQIISSIFVDRGIEALMTAKLITEAAGWDAALLISRRAELSPAIAAVKAMGKAVDVAFFHFQIAPVNPLAALADRHRVITIEEALAVRKSGPRPPSF